MNKIVLSLTKTYLDSISADYLGLEKVRVTDKLEVEVIKFTSRHNAKLGQTTLVGTIIIHEKSFENPEMLRYIVAHEYGHYKSVLSFISTWAILVGWLSGTASLVYGIFTADLTLALSAVLILLGCFALSWIVEYRADAKALDLLGVEKVKAAYVMMGNIPKPGLLWMIISQLTHPSLATILKIYRWLRRGKTLNSKS